MRDFKVYLSQDPIAMSGKVAVPDRFSCHSEDILEAVNTYADSHFPLAPGDKFSCLIQSDDGVVTSFHVECVTWQEFTVIVSFIHEFDRCGCDDCQR